MHSELMLSPSPSTSGTGGETPEEKHCMRRTDLIAGKWFDRHGAVGCLMRDLNSPAFLMGKSDLRCMVEGSSFMRSDICRLKGEVF